MGKKFRKQNFKKIIVTCLLMIFVLIGQMTFAATPQTIGGGSEPLRINTNTNGDYGVYMLQGSNYQHQYYSGFSWGSTLHFDDAGNRKHLGSSYYGNSFGVPTVTKVDAQTLKVVWLTYGGGIRLTQTLHYPANQRHIDKTWAVENLSVDKTYDNLSFIHGGDTYFSGNDSARSYWANASKVIYLKNPDITRDGLMTFLGKASSPVDAYFGGRYNTGRTQSTAGVLNNTADSNFLDAGYQLQWDKSALGPGQKWTIEATEAFTSPGYCQVIPVPSKTLLAGSSASYDILIQNFHGSSQTFNYTATSEHGWPVSLSSSSGTIAGNAATENVTLTVDTPLNTDTVDKVTFTATSATDSSIKNSVVISTGSDALPPTNTSISVLGGSVTNQRDITVELFADDATEIMVSINDDFSGASWEVYSLYKELRVSDGDGDKYAYAKFKDAVGNISDPISTVVRYDTTPPQTPTMEITSSKLTQNKNVIIKLSAVDATEMMLSEQADFSGAVWEALAAEKTFTVTDGDGEKTIYVKYKDVAGNETTAIHDSLVIDTTAPTGGSVSIREGDRTNNESIMLDLSATDATEMMISEASDFSGGSWETYGTEKSFDLSSSDGSKTVYVKYRDLAGNETSVFSDTIVYDGTVPSDASVSVKEGAHVNDSSVTLALSVTEADEVMISEASDFSGGIWMPISAEKPITLSSGDGEKTIYVKYRDLSGNESSVVSATVNLDTASPTDSTVTITEGDLTKTSSITLSLSSTGSSEVLISETLDFIGSTWSEITAEKLITLSDGDGEKTLYVKFRDLAGNETAVIEKIINLDTTAPTGGGMSIREGDHTNNLTVTLDLSVTDATEMMMSEAPDFSGGSWEALAAERVFTLSSGDGSKTIYTKYKDLAGNETAVFSDTIAYDGTAPDNISVSFDEGIATNKREVTINLNAEEASWVLISELEDFSDATWQEYSPSKKILLSESDGNKTVYVKFKDSVGNETSPIEKSILYDTLMPQSPKVELKGPSTTKDKEIVFALSADDASNIMVSAHSDFSDAVWEEISPEKKYTLSDGDGNKILYVKFKDISGNETSVIEKHFLLDTKVPEMELKGNPTVQVELNEPYVDKGADVNDLNLDAFTTSNPVDITAEGIYYVTYKAVDTAGNIRVIERKVIVGDPENLRAEVLKITSETPDGYYKSGDEIDIEMTFDLPVGVTGQPVLSLNNGGEAVYLNQASDEKVTFRYVISTSDTSGSVNYKDVNSLQIDENNFISLKTKTNTTTDSGTQVKAQTFDGVLTTSGGIVVTATGAATTTTGASTSFKFEDVKLTLPSPESTKNTLHNRAIIVDTIAPSIELKGEDSMLVYEYVPYEEPGVKTSDNYGIDGVIIEGKVNVYDSGTNELTYYVLDLAGNKSEVLKRIIKVEQKQYEPATETHVKEGKERESSSSSKSSDGKKEEKSSDEKATNNKTNQQKDLDSNESLVEKTSSDVSKNPSTAVENKQVDELNQMLKTEDYSEEAAVKVVNNQKTVVNALEENGERHVDAAQAIDGMMEAIKRIEDQTSRQDALASARELITTHMPEAYRGQQLKELEIIEKNAIEKQASQELEGDLMIDVSDASKVKNALEENGADFSREDNVAVFKMSGVEGSERTVTVSDESVNLMKESGIESLKVNFEDDLAVVMPLDQEPVSMEKRGSIVLVWDNGAGSTLMMSPEDSVPEVRPDYVSLVQYVGDTRVVLPTRYNYATGMIEGDLTVNDGMFKLEPVEPVDIFSDPALNEKLMILKARGQLHDFANGEVTRGSFASDLVQAFNIKRLESNDTSDTSGSFGDVNVEELSDGIQIAVNNGLLLGFEDGTLRLDDPLTKEQQAVILSRVFEQLENDEMTSYQVSYSDIGQIAPWALEELGKLKPFRIYSDDTKVFEPGNQVDGEILVETMYNVYDHYTEIN